MIKNKKQFKTAARETHEKFNKKISKLARTVVTSRKVMKSGQMSVTVTKRKPYNILDNEEQFFKSQFDKDKRKLFLE